MARPKKKAEKQQALWLLTYCDMVTLLMIFFILLFSMSTLDADKWKALVANLSGNPSIFDFTTQSNAQGPHGVEEPPALDAEDLIGDADEWEMIVDGLRQMIDALEPGETDTDEHGNPIGQTASGIFISLDDANDTEILIRCHGEVLFDVLSDVLRPEFEAFINDTIIRKMVAPLVEDESVSIVRIEGHTDSQTVPPGNYFQDNWKLSAARASRILRHIERNFPELDGVLGIAGYADLRPVNPDGRFDPAQFAKNRRVEFVLVRNLAKLPTRDMIGSG